MQQRKLRPSLLLLLWVTTGAVAALTPAQKAQNLESFEVVWKTVRDRHPDPNLNGLNWKAVHDATRPLIERAASMEEVRSVLTAMLAKLGASHYAIIPRDRYQPAAKSTEPAPVQNSTVAGGIDPPKPSEPDPTPPEGKLPESKQPEGKLVRFGNLPESRLVFETRVLPGGAGYIRFNEFLDPVSLMPQIEKAVNDYAHAPGIILDLRGNRGGIGMMAMGIAGFFIAEPGHKLGEMTTRDTTIKFVIFPRAETYAGPLAILVDSGSASTSEILAQGLHDLGRARIFGTPTAGAALPSDIVRLPRAREGAQVLDVRRQVVAHHHGRLTAGDVDRIEESARIDGHDVGAGKLPRVRIGGTVVHHGHAPAHRTGRGHDRACIGAGSAHEQMRRRREELREGAHTRGTVLEDELARGSRGQRLSCRILKERRQRREAECAEG